ncbi:lipopolysaccharide biosynthesis protein [Bacillus sp. AFS031507]|uniref:lipopolysaccharide biosynthesis protein n=1 Tax=Bacillus sp. AFS031507 TaxID=2033496 RepID=UPI000BFE3AD8|nr:oligosaccharide flippase family protein [Bacillus sp. AFS031507]PGY12663.1 hypothetical protein COE25_09885 [Bacillus sp. AFS031507]
MSNYNKVIKKSISLNFLYKVVGMSIGYLTLPYILSNMGNEMYGIWITIFNTVVWINFLDIGIGNGLKNKLTESVTTNKIDIAKSFILNSYILSFIISTCIFIVSYILISFININSFLNLDKINEHTIKLSLMITILFVCINFIARLNEQLYYGTHKSEVVGLKVIINQIISFIGVIVLVQTKNLTLVSLALNYGLVQSFIEILFTFWFFIENKNLIPSFNSIKLTKYREILGLGVKFFIIQISMVVIYNTDNIIVLKFLGPEQVTIYTLVSKIFSIFILISTIVLTPFWALFADAYVKKDFIWIKNTFKKFNILSILVLLGSLGLSLIMEYILLLWTGKVVKVEILFSLLFAVFISIRIFNNVYMFFLNGAAIVNLQMYLYVLGAFINIPLTIIFIKMGLSLSGIMLGSIISILPMAIILTLQVYKIIKKEEKMIVMSKTSKGR